MICEELEAFKDLWMTICVYVNRFKDGCRLSIRARKVIFDFENRVLIAELFGHRDAVVVYSHDSGLLVIKDRDREIIKSKLNVKKAEVSGAPDEFLIVLDLI